MKNRHSNIIAFFIIFTLVICKSFSQSTTTESDFWNKVRFGGNIGAGFNNNFTSIIIAPQAIYQLKPNFGVGLGLNYSYSERDVNNASFQDFSSNIYGTSIIGIANPIDYLQVSADFEYFYVNQNFENSALDREYWVPALFLGAGYRQGNFVIGFRYDILYNDDKSIYNNGLQPFVRLLF
ncbi:alpha-ketoglutarate decarboxylase [Nonlabens sp. SY33080]|uniref:alpha-ketoglutarate decarboxylase n=1 Tax=Nonlabens sp. SY33080 TaxID=2719911 RepID=UPI00197DFB85|nr:alpha-ketoglutarate decarboxylase [Nonlabens sp. SY33080]